MKLKVIIFLLTFTFSIYPQSLESEFKKFGEKILQEIMKGDLELTNYIAPQEYRIKIYAASENLDEKELKKSWSNVERNEKKYFKYFNQKYELFHIKNEEFSISEDKIQIKKMKGLNLGGYESIFYTKKAKYEFKASLVKIDNKIYLSSPAGMGAIITLVITGNFKVNKGSNLSRDTNKALKVTKDYIASMYNGNYEAFKKVLDKKSSEDLTSKTSIFHQKSQKEISEMLKKFISQEIGPNDGTHTYKYDKNLMTVYIYRNNKKTKFKIKLIEENKQLKIKLR
ncbi:hypothetical protein LNTAR_21695 [Lentisphaera araneosa HTCC2155]|uniref:Uncharacterized protein n=1 Tax=Lentisphaera araneosa HTCC2155 TaxID=313628 RepID=A6DM73_9BACT|nr:hypothetical protein [Lentisphaera araneosa]EDM27371.1 hypothetical protein LNTAR_21695 [Lentisphaera araneosa HTCC2155]